MLDLLAAAEQALPDLLLDDAGWQSLDIDYHPPKVERLFRRWGDGMRLNLHRIHPCAPGAPLFHPHPWPSAIQVITGQYQMRIGYGPGTEPPPVAATLTLVPGSRYAMTAPDAWHDVRPIDQPSLSIMITGRPWKRRVPLAPERPLKPLSPDARAALLRRFREHYA